MLRTCSFVGFIFAILAISADSTPAHAQAAQPPAVKTVPINAAVAGVTRLYEDLDYVFGLAKEPKALKDLKETLDVFFDGMDLKSPVVFQVYVRKGSFNTVMHVPTKPPAKDFRNNIKTLGVKNKLTAPGMYQVNGLFNGWLKENAGITILAKDRADIIALPGGLAPFKATLAAKDYDFVAHILNDEAQTNDRKAAIEDLRKQVVEPLKKLKNETDAEFDLRKLTIDQQLTELKQIYGEAKTVHTYLDLVPANKKLVSATDLVALPGTELAKVIDDLAKEPSYFANIPLSDKEPLSGMINLKLDALRQKHVANFLKQARPLMLKEIKESEGNSPKTKEYNLISTDIVFDVLEKSAADGIFDSFIDVHANAGGLHTMIAGNRVNGAVVMPGLKKLADTAKVELNAGKHGDVDFHKVTLPTDLVELQKIYGKDLVLIIGTGPKAVWYALGEKAEEKLKEAIDKAGQPAPAPNNVVSHLHGKALLWYELFDANRTKHKKGDAEARKRAIDALKGGDDVFEFKMEKVEGKLSASLNLNEGILRYFGKVGAKFVTENLQN